MMQLAKMEEETDNVCAMIGCSLRMQLGWLPLHSLYVGGAMTVKWVMCPKVN